MKGYVIKDTNGNYQEIRKFNLKTFKQKKFEIEFLNGNEETICVYDCPSKRYMYLKTLTNFIQALDYISKNITELNIQKYEKDTIWFYEHNLELSRRRIMYEIYNKPTEEDTYWNEVRNEIEKFQVENNVELTIRGHSKRHCCIEDTALNRLRYQDLRDKFQTMQDNFVKRMNGDDNE